MTTTEPTTEEEALWAAIGAAPDDALPRLVLADYYDERVGVVVCQAIGPHHHDVCNGGRIEAPNSAFTMDCPACSGTGVVSNGHAETAEGLRMTADRVPRCKNGRWQWRRDGAGELSAPFRLPVDLWVEVCRITPSNAHRTRWARFVSAGSAIRFMVRAWCKIHKGVSL